MLRAGRGRPDPRRSRKVVDHRRVLGDDHRGRRQLPAAALPREEGAECDIQFVTRGCSSCSGRCATTRKQRAELRGMDDARKTASKARRLRRARSWSGCCGGRQGRPRASSRPSRTPSASTATTCPTWTRSPRSATHYYNNDLRGGEGHMEVGKLILNVLHKQGAHDAVSVKPFGCMPSSGVSDGVQSLITEKLPAAPSSARSRPAATARSTSTRACRCSCSRPGWRPRRSTPTARAAWA